MVRSQRQPLLTRAIPGALLLLVLALALLGRTAASQPVAPRGVLIYCDRGGANADRVCSAEQWDLVRDVYAGLGHPVDIVYVLPPDLSGYRLVIVAIPTRLFEAAERQALEGYLRYGRLLVLVGENVDFYDETIGPLNALLETLDVGARFEAASLDLGCGHTATPQPHPLTAGVERYDYAFSTTVSGGVPLVTHDETGAALVTWDRVGPNGPPNGEVVLFGDANSFIADCERGHNVRLLQNLIAPR
jgi:hypothetical protein